MSANSRLPEGNGSDSRPSWESESPFLDLELLGETEDEAAGAWTSHLGEHQFEGPFQSAFKAGLETLVEPEVDIVEEAFYDEELDKAGGEAHAAALQLESPFQNDLELDQRSFIEPETPEGEFAGEDEESLDEAFPAYLDELEEEGRFLDAQAFYSEEGLLPPGAEHELAVDAWEAVAPGRQPQTREPAESQVARFDEEFEQIAAELENISAHLLSQESPQEEGQLGFVFSRFGSLFSLGRASAAADPSAAVPPFNFLKRLLMPAPVLDAAQSANAIRWNQRQHPRTSGVDPNDIRTDLQRYVNLSAIQVAINNFNQANPSAQIAMGTSPIDAVFVEAVHQFQAKCFFETGQIDGLAGESTLDSLGIIVRSGMNAADRPNTGAVRRLRRADVPGETGGEFTANNWFDSMVNPSFLGWRFTTGGSVRGVHLYFMRKLRLAEKALLAQPRFRGMTPVQLGKALGFSARSEEHKGARPGATSASMHTYGLSVDIMYSGNPWVKGTAFTNALKRAALLVSGNQITQATSQQFFHSLGSDPNLTTAQIFDILLQRDQDFRQYLGLHNDPAELRNRLNQRLAAGTPGVFASSAETVDQAVHRWQRLIRQDRANMRANNSPFRKGDGTLREPLSGFLNLDKDLVVALRDKACLAWGAVDIGPGADGSGDIMHFDARVCELGDRLASVGGNSRVTRGHSCLPCSPGGDGSTAAMRELEAEKEEELYREQTLAIQEAPFVSEAIWNEVEYEQVGYPLQEASNVEDEGAFGEEAFLGTAPFLPEWLTDAVKGGLLNLQAAWAMLSGQRDVNTLTNMVFHARNPELPEGYKIQPHEKQLVQEWLRIRDDVIKPTLRRLAASAPTGPSLHAAPAPAAPLSTTSASSGLPKLGAGQTPPTDPNAYRRFRLTTYYIADQSESPTGTVRVPIYDDGGRKIAEGSPKFFAQLSLEGTGRLTDGRLVNVTGKKVAVSHQDYAEVLAYHRQAYTKRDRKRREEGRKPIPTTYSGIVVENDRVVSALAFHLVPASKLSVGYGRQRGIPYVPFRTLAADIGLKRMHEQKLKGKGGLVPPQTQVYIHEYDGLQLPDGTRHDGWFVVNDTGGGIYGAHFDVFVGTRALREQVKLPGFGRVWFDGIEQRIPRSYTYGLKS